MSKVQTPVKLGPQPPALKQAAPVPVVTHHKEEPSPAATPRKPRWRVKHAAIGAFVVEADSPDEAKEKVLRDKYPGESQDPKWLDTMKGMSMRVARLPDEPIVKDLGPK